MHEYQTLFDARGGHYNRANRLYPEVRAQEIGEALEALGARLFETPCRIPWTMNYVSGSPA